MIKPAQLYAEQLKKKEIESWYDLKNIYYSGWIGRSITQLPDNNYDSHHFVSVDKEDNVIGYMSYNMNWLAMSVDGFGIISFDKGNIEFAKDVYNVICDLFKKYNMNRISWCCFADNPAIRGYRNFIKKHGGRECSYKRQVARLMDGKLHDSVEFEILAEEFNR